MQKKLYPHEWLFVLTGLTMVFGVFLIAYLYDPEIPNEVRKEMQKAEGKKRKSRGVRRKRVRANTKRREGGSQTIKKQL